MSRHTLKRDPVLREGNWVALGTGPFHPQIGLISHVGSDTLVFEKYAAFVNIEIGNKRKILEGPLSVGLNGAPYRLLSGEDEALSLLDNSHLDHVKNIYVISNMGEPLYVGLVSKAFKNSDNLTNIVLGTYLGRNLVTGQVSLLTGNVPINDLEDREYKRLNYFEFVAYIESQIVSKEPSFVENGYPEYVF